MVSLKHESQIIARKFSLMSQLARNIRGLEPGILPEIITVDLPVASGLMHQQLYNGSDGLNDLLGDHPK